MMETEGLLMALAGIIQTQYDIPCNNQNYEMAILSSHNFKDLKKSDLRELKSTLKHRLGVLVQKQSC